MASAGLTSALRVVILLAVLVASAMVADRLYGADAGLLKGTQHDALQTIKLLAVPPPEHRGAYACGLSVNQTTYRRAHGNTGARMNRIGADWENGWGHTFSKTWLEKPFDAIDATNATNATNATIAADATPQAKVERQNAVGYLYAWTAAVVFASPFYFLAVFGVTFAASVLGALTLACISRLMEPCKTDSGFVKAVLAWLPFMNGTGGETVAIYIFGKERDPKYHPPVPTIIVLTSVLIVASAFWGCALLHSSPPPCSAHARSSRTQVRHTVRPQSAWRRRAQILHATGRLPARRGRGVGRGQRLGGAVAGERVCADRLVGYRGDIGHRDDLSIRVWSSREFKVKVPDRINCWS